MRALHKAYHRAELPRHKGKSIWGASQAEFWGAEVLGVEGIARPNFKRTIPVVSFFVAETLRVDHAIVRLLEVVSGAFVSIFQYRRRVLSLLSEVYSAQHSRKPTDIVRLSAELREELTCVARLPLSLWPWTPPPPAEPVFSRP